MEEIIPAKFSKKKEIEGDGTSDVDENTCDTTTFQNQEDKQSVEKEQKKLNEKGNRAKDEKSKAANKVINNGSKECVDYSNEIINYSKFGSELTSDIIDRRIDHFFTMERSNIRRATIDFLKGIEQINDEEIIAEDRINFARKIIDNLKCKNKHCQSPEYQEFSNNYTNFEEFLIENLSSMETFNCFCLDLVRCSFESKEYIQIRELPSSQDLSYKSSNLIDSSLNINSKSFQKLYKVIKTKLDKENNTGVKIINVALARRIKILHKFCSIYFDNWLHMFLGIIQRNECLFENKNKLIIESLQANNQIGPFISLETVIKKLMIVGDFSNSNWLSKMGEILKLYNARASRVLKEIYVCVKKSTVNENLEPLDTNIANMSQKRKLCTIGKLDYQFISWLENYKIDTKDNRKEVIFEKGKDYTNTIGGSISYSIPDISEEKIVIAESLCKKVKTEVSFYLSSSISSQCSKIEKLEITQEEKDNLMLAINDFDVGSYQPKKKIASELDYQDSMSKIVFKTFQEDTMKSYYEDILKTFKEDKSNIMEYLKRTQIIEEDKDLDEEKLEVRLKKHIYNISKLKICTLDKFIFVDPTSKEARAKILAGILYGGFPNYLDIESISDTESKNKISLFKDRCTSINFLMNHLIFHSKHLNKYNESLLDFIVNEMELNDVNKEKQHIPGEHHSILVSKETIYTKPFESIMKLLSTRARLYVLYNWKMLICNPNFKNQTTYHELFGFTYSKEGKCTKNIFKPFTCISKPSQESKIASALKIVSKINKLVRELEKVLVWRYLVEGQVAKNKVFNKTFERSNNISEDMLYKVIVTYMYFLSLCLYPDFDIDAAFRSKLICNKHNCDINEHFPRCPCLCCYSIESNYISQALLKKIDHDFKVEIELKKDFNRKDKKSTWKIKESKKESMISKAKSLYTDNECIKTLEKSLKVDLTFLQGKIRKPP